MFRSLRGLTLFASVLYVFCAIARGAPAPGSSPTPAPPLMTTAAKAGAFYVMMDPAGDKGSATLIALATATELNRYFSGDLPGNPRGSAFGANPNQVWAIPEPSWTLEMLAQQCESDSNTIGAVLITHYIGDATHYWLLWQTQTTSIEMWAQFVSCNRKGTVGTPPETVAVVSELHNSRGTPWVERRTDASVPLLTGLALLALFNHTAAKSEPTSYISLATIGLAVQSNSFNKDIPGYSQPVRYRFDAHHAGQDIATELRWLCGIPDTTAAEPVRPLPVSDQLNDLCEKLGWPQH